MQGQGLIGLGMRMLQGGKDKTGFGDLYESLGVTRGRSEDPAKLLAAAIAASKMGDDKDITEDITPELVYGPMFENLEGKTPEEIIASPNLSFPEGSADKIIQDYEDPGGAINEDLGLDRSDLLGKGYALGADFLRYAKFPFLSTLLEPTVLGDGTLYGNEYEYATEDELNALGLGKADGGRVGLQNGGQPMAGQQPMGAVSELLTTVGPQPMGAAGQPTPNPLPPATQGLQPGSNAFRSAMQSSAMDASPLLSVSNDTFPVNPPTGNELPIGPRPPLPGDPGYDPTLPDGYEGPSYDFFSQFRPMGPAYGAPMQPQTFQQPSEPFQFGMDIGDYLGGPDPFAIAYNPYAYATGTEDAYGQYGLNMGEDEIMDAFSDLDKYSLAAQEAKRKAEEEAKKAKQTGPAREGGGGGGNNNNNNNSNNNTGTGGVAGAGIDGTGGPDSNYG